MFGAHSQVWVTSVLTDEDVERALTLCFSLRRNYTTRKIAVIVSRKLSFDLRRALEHAFDLVFDVEEQWNKTTLKMDSFVKIYGLVALRSFECCAYLSPTTIVLKNFDDIFAEKVENFRLPEDAAITSVFLFKPSVARFEQLMNLLGQSNKAADVENCLRTWLINQCMESGSLDAKYCKQLSSDKYILGFEGGTSIVDLKAFSTQSILASVEEYGMLGNLVTIYWRKIYEQQVLPLISQKAKFPKTIMEPSIITGNYSKEPIAIVGMSCRYPGSNNLEEFWELLFQGQDGTSTPPDFRWRREQTRSPCADAKNTNAGFLKVPVDEFDARFFGISPKEALLLDPQHRLLHELVWEGLEDACINPQSLHGSLGSVFVGTWTNQYKNVLEESGNDEFFRLYMGNSIGAAAARISFLLGLMGPSISTESGCSSAMVALHLACRSLRNGETNMAIACGANLLLCPFGKDDMPMMLSSDGHSKTFSADANGFARAEGGGVLILKRLSDALIDGDRFWGLIRGSAIAQEGMSKSLGTPTIDCESFAMKEALNDAQVLPEQVSYVEAHGTGTVVGDPMEISAIAKAYHTPNRKRPLVIGSVKTNVGHTESCSGITGIMKVVLSMKHELIPAHINFSELNPSVDLGAIPAEIPLEQRKWARIQNQPRLAGVSSFGITGTDAHVILEEAPISAVCTPALTVDRSLDRPVHILKLCAKTEEALHMLLEQYRDTLQLSEHSIDDICYSANTGRADFPIRVALVAKSKAELCEVIERQRYTVGEVSTEDAGRICFLFTGQGSQYQGMARQLYETCPVFRIHFEYCDHILTRQHGIHIKNVLWSNDESGADISQTIYSQTSIFCVEYALLKLWESLGVKPDYVLGHSLGEFAAAVCAGILSVDDALTLVAERSHLTDALPPGKMLVIKASQQQVDRLMKQFTGKNGGKLLDYAAINSNEQTVVSGDSDLILDFSEFCSTNKIKSIVLGSTHAFHSSHMDPILQSYRDVAQTVTNLIGHKSCTYISGMHGDIIQAHQIDAEYWVQHTREKVSFLSASQKAVELGCKTFIEIGPQPVLSALTLLNNSAPLLCLPSLKRKEEDWQTLLGSLAQLYTKGVKIKWEGLDQFHSRQKVRIPNYPFIRKQFWPEIIRPVGQSIHSLIGSPFQNASSTKIFQASISTKTHEYIRDHVIGHTVIFPGAGYLEMCLAAGFASIQATADTLGKPCRPLKVENLNICAPFPVSDSKTSLVQTMVEFNTDKDDDSGASAVVKIYRRMDGDLNDSSWLQHAHSKFSPVLIPQELTPPSNDLPKLDEILAKTSESDDTILKSIYEKLSALGLKFGPVFQSIEHIWQEPSSILAKVKVPSEQTGYSQYIIHPVILDAMIQAIMMMMLNTNKSLLKNKLFVPIKIGKFVWTGREEEVASSDLYIQVFGDHSVHSDFFATLLNSSGECMAVMSQVEFIETTVGAMESVLEQQVKSMPDLWEEVWRQDKQSTSSLVNMDIVKKCMEEEAKFHLENYTRKSNEDKNVVQLQYIVKEMECLVHYNMLRGILECGWSPVLNQVLDENELMEDLGIKPEFAKQFHYFLTVFEQEGILERVKEQFGRYLVIKLPPTLSQIENELSTPRYSEHLVKKFKSTLLFSKIGSQLSSILRGSQSALNILFPESSVSGESSEGEPSAAEFYKDFGALLGSRESWEKYGRVWFKEYKRQVTLTGSELPVFRVLEVGAGTGLYTQRFLEAVEEVGIDVEYTFTDISRSFFPAAEKKFEKFVKHMKFKSLNIEEDPIAQGFVPGYYDIVRAGDVIHATKNLEETLANVRTLLKVGGMFDLVEMTRKNRFITYAFGLLEGFWRFEDYHIRQDHCFLSLSRWVDVIQANGFSVYGQYPCANEETSNIKSIRTDEDQLSKMETGKKWLVFHQESSPISQYLINCIPKMAGGRNVIVVIPSNKSDVGRDNCHLRPDVEKDFRELLEAYSPRSAGDSSQLEGIIYCWSLDETHVSQEHLLKPFFLLAKSVLNLRQSPSPRLFALIHGTSPVGADCDMSQNVHASTLQGFIKSLRNENINLHCKCIDVERKNDANSLLQIFYELWGDHKDTQVQVTLRKGVRHIPKFVPHKPSLKDKKTPNGVNRFQLVLPETKSIEDLEFGPLEPFTLAPEEIEIQVKVSALNFRDVFSVLKPSEKFKNSNAVGFDFAGVVKQVHSEGSKWNVGDAVFGVNVNGTALPSHVKVHQDDVLAVPEYITLNEACTLPAVVVTSYHCLIEVAKISSSDVVLIHAASGGVGLSAIEICKNVGATIIATAGSRRKQEYLRSLGIQHIFHSRSTDYCPQILDFRQHLLTGACGVRLEWLWKRICQELSHSPLFRAFLHWNTL